ncbi:unnamed protein product [Spirodela intermedia]|uniref:J domain-containing protein n=1 Tax=Spirodela intermedia TaxID=51605 RepID=A0A7I8J5F8_SPIIN|nr:unnamed protein product [Spirodela intermedia]CAA6665467.1 unnamed protein product [Spirodela intermedia]
MEERGVRESLGDYYTVLGIRRDSSSADVRSAYRRLALKWHPDRWAGREGRETSARGEAKRRFQKILEAYQVLSDERKRLLYDAGLFNSRERRRWLRPGGGRGYNPFPSLTFRLSATGFAGFVQEMVDLMSNVRRQKIYSLEELQQMLFDMAGDSTPPTPSPMGASGAGEL